MKRIELKLKESDGIGIFHDSRGDIKKLAKVINLLIIKVNELVDENGQIQKWKQDISSFKSEF